MEKKQIKPKIDSVKLSRLKKMIEHLDKHYAGSPEVDPELTFEYIVGSLFPTVYQNVINEINMQYTKGYIQGREDMKNEIEGTS